MSFFPTSTKSSLPASPAQGDANYVTDKERGVWVASQASTPSWFSLAGEAINLKEFGARSFDGGSISASSAAFTTAASCFVSGDVGSVISIEGAGTNGSDLITTIASYSSGTSVTLTDAASRTVSATRFDFGTESTTAFGNAIAAIPATGGTLLVPPGFYLLTDSVEIPASVSVVFMRGGVFSLRSGVVLTIRGPLEAGLFRIFAGGGEVSFGTTETDTLVGSAISSGVVSHTKPEWWGVNADRVSFSDGAISLNANTLTTASPHFTSSDAGKAISIVGAGPYGNVLTTSITAVNSASSVTLADNAMTDYHESGGAEYEFMSDAAPDFQKCLDAGKDVLVSGIYVFNQGVTLNKRVSLLGVDPHVSRLIYSLDSGHFITIAEGVGINGSSASLWFKNLNICARTTYDSPSADSTDITSVGVYSGYFSSQIKLENTLIQFFGTGMNLTDTVTLRMHYSVVRGCHVGLTFPHVEGHEGPSTSVMLESCNLAGCRTAVDGLPIGSSVINCVFEANTYCAFYGIRDNCRLIGNWFEGYQDCIRGNFYYCTIIGPGIMSSDVQTLLRDTTEDMSYFNVLVQMGVAGAEIEATNLIPLSRLGRAKAKGGIGVQGTSEAAYLPVMDGLALNSATDGFEPRLDKVQKITYTDKDPSITVGKRISGDLLINVGGKGIYVCTYPRTGYGCVGETFSRLDANASGQSGNPYISVAYDGFRDRIQDEDSLVFPGDTPEIVTVIHPKSIRTRANTVYDGDNVVPFALDVDSADDLAIGYRVKLEDLNEECTIIGIDGTRLTLESKLFGTYVNAGLTVVPVKLYTVSASGTASSDTLTLRRPDMGSGSLGIVAGDRLLLSKTSGSPPVTTTEEVEVSDVSDPVYATVMEPDFPIGTLIGLTATLTDFLSNDFDAASCVTTKVVLSKPLVNSYGLGPYDLPGQIKNELCVWKLIPPIGNPDGTFTLDGDTQLGTSSSQKLSLWGATPVVQPSAVANVTGGSTVDTEARTALNALLAKLRTIGILAT